MNKNFSKTSRNHQSKNNLESFKTHAVDDKNVFQAKYLNYSGGSYISKNETQKSMSAKSCHSTEPQSRNPSKPVVCFPQKESMRMSTHTNPNFVQKSSVNFSKEGQKVPQKIESFENSHSSKFGSSINIQKNEEDFGRIKELEKRVDDFASSNQKLSIILRKTQQKLYTLEKKYKSSENK